MRILLVFIGFTFSFQVSSQVTFNKTRHDFGELESYSIRYVDIILTNTSQKQEWLLSVKKPREVIYITSKQIMEADSSIIVRLQVNPSKKGKFSYEVNIFTSDQGEPTKIKLLGSIKELGESDMSGFTDCPDFSSRPGGADPNKFNLTVVTIDKESREELSKSTVTMIQNGQAIWTNKTNKDGRIKEDASIGLSYFYATHTGYFPAELGAYVNFKRNFVVVELERKEEDIVVEVPPVDTTVLVENTPDEIIIEIEEEPQMDSTVIAETPPSFFDIDKDNFEEEYFKPVNVVFVLDVSSSMRHADKVELMKYALYQLTDMLRPQDRMGIVTYSSSVEVILKSTNGGNKEAIKKEVSELKASGFTAGGAGIKMGFKEAKRNKLTDGTNHVIVITDGAFNRMSDNYKKQIKKYKKKGINLSVVGIKNKPVDEKKMREDAQLGGGHYIPIFKLADAQNNLRQEIRLLSYKF